MEENSDILIGKALLTVLTVIMILLIILAALLIDQSGTQGGLY